MRLTKHVVLLLLGAGVLLLLNFSSLLRLPHPTLLVWRGSPAREQEHAKGKTPPRTHLKNTTRPPSTSPPPPGPPTALPVYVSKELRKLVPQSNAYWNRQVHSALTALEQLTTSSPGSPHTSQDPDHPHCQPVPLQTLRGQIQDFDSYSPLYKDLLQGAHCHDYPLLIDQPGKCGGPTETPTGAQTGNQSSPMKDTTEPEHGPFLLLAIKSVPHNFQQRQAVRQTWGWEGRHWGDLEVRTVFLLGSSAATDEPDLGVLLAAEAGRYGDILQWDFRDSFFNLTLKDGLFLRWAERHCPRARFVFKGDDDVFANTFQMLKYLQHVGDAKLYTGQIVEQASPFRDAKNKYYIPHSYYDGVYPPYAGGGGFLFSGSLLRPLSLLSRLLPPFPIDDVFTGICMQALHVVPTSHSGFRTFDIMERDREDACIHRDLLVVHHRTPQQTLRLWRRIQDTSLQC
ncbi:N-acetyllactosaminide beta-1,3-N-acetylglucosaminyltransferase 2 [Amia ocellicauda]|uniref:N-acetyllactosaminide beta-1,3-N-acetylglucosaminyltransferase 2 n=1 Tax=Amia ocellicauda TaxID=2972642 RepID=UPI00346468AB|nr:B3GN2 acetylglucosaminyltransferase [Amia calva]